MEKETDDALELARATTRAQTKALRAAIDPDLDARDDAIEAQLSRENSSAKSKLGKLYRLVAEFSEAAKPFVPCAKGCSACCKMNVSITSVEAQRLALVTGRRMATIYEPVQHDVKEFSGIPCPFLVNEACSVYEARPYACRAHFSFDSSSHWCQPERAYVDGMHGLELGGARKAYVGLALNTAMGGFADIRDFFPS